MVVRVLARAACAAHLHGVCRVRTTLGTNRTTRSQVAQPRASRFAPQPSREIPCDVVGMSRPEPVPSTPPPARSGRSEPFEGTQIIRWIAQLSEALQFAHGRRVLHRGAFAPPPARLSNPVPLRSARATVTLAMLSLFVMRRTAQCIDASTLISRRCQVCQYFPLRRQLLQARRFRGGA